MLGAPGVCVDATEASDSVVSIGNNAKLSSG